MVLMLYIRKGVGNRWGHENIPKDRDFTPGEGKETSYPCMRGGRTRIGGEAAKASGRITAAATRARERDQRFGSGAPRGRTSPAAAAR